MISILTRNTSLKEHLEKLGLKWAYSSTMGYYIGFKVTVVVNKKNMVPVAILIDSGSPNDKKIFEDVLKNLLKRRIIKRKDIIYFDRGYCSYKNYIIGINEFGIVPMIFPQGFFKEEKLRSKISYPLDVFSNNKPNNKLKHDIKFMLELLCEKLKNWKKFKPIRGIIEDFFKVGKCALNLWKFHSYTTESMHRKIYLCILLVVLVTQEGYTTKTKMQRLSEGDVVQDTPINKKSKKKKNKSKNKYKKPAPKKTKQTKLKISRKEPQKTLKQTTII